jgi:hypothetical protein
LLEVFKTLVEDVVVVEAEVVEAGPVASAEFFGAQVADIVAVHGQLEQGGPVAL